jgi:hypothetical protein
VYGQKPKVTRPVTFDKLSELERIPCASVLVRLQRAPVDNKGNPMLINKPLPLGGTGDEELVTLPPAYSKGKYNTQFFEPFDDEMIIFKHKNERRDPNMVDTIKTIKSLKSTDKKFVKRLKKATK